MTGDLDVRQRIVQAVARREGCEVADLEESLYGAIDPDALREIVDAEAFDSIAFSYLGYTVVVVGGGRIEITDDVREMSSSTRPAQD